MKKRSGYFWSDRAEAEAIVLSIKKAGSSSGKQPQVKMQMQVQPERGRNFVTEINEIIPLAELANYNTGMKIKVKYNPRNTKEVLVVKQSVQNKMPFAN